MVLRFVSIYCNMIWNIFIWFWDNLGFIAVARCLKMALIVTPSMNQFLMLRGGKYQHHINNTNWQINDHSEPNIGQNYTRTAGRHGLCYINKTSHSGQPRDTWHSVMTWVSHVRWQREPAVWACSERLGDTSWSLQAVIQECECLEFLKSSVDWLVILDVFHTLSYNNHHPRPGRDIVGEVLL